MKALLVTGEWDPREGASFTREEIEQKKALIGCQAWKHTRFEIKEVPTPDIREHEVLIKVKSCGICGSDTHLYENDKEGYIIFSGLTSLPCIPGHEFSGIVEKIGSRVTTLQVGDKVSGESVLWCGVCQPCRSGHPNQCEKVELIGLSRDGALAEHIAIDEKYCWKINELARVYPEEVLYNAGALIEPIGCAYNGLFVSGGGVLPGATVAVYGAGPIGLGAIALAKIAGAGLIIAFDMNAERTQIARDMGADYAFDISTMDGCTPGEKVLELTGGKGADIQVEAAGAAPDTIPEMEKSLAPLGKIIYLGRAAIATPMFLDALVSGANKIVGSRGHSGYGIFPHIIKLLMFGKLDVLKMITSIYPFAEALTAFEDSGKRRDGKILIHIE